MKKCENKDEQMKMGRDDKEYTHQIQKKRWWIGQANANGKRWQRKQIIAYGKRRLKRWVIVHGKKWWREQANAKRKKHQGGWISTSGKRRMHSYLKNKTIGGQKTIGKIKMTRKAKWEGGQITTRRGFARGNGS